MSDVEFKESSFDEIMLYLILISQKIRYVNLDIFGDFNRYIYDNAYSKVKTFFPVFSTKSSAMSY